MGHARYECGDLTPMEARMIIAATGHRPDKLGGYGADVRDRLRKIAREYLALSLADFTVSGMALGWDTAFAEASLELGIPFIAAVPFKGQEKLWPAESRWHYRKLLDRAKYVKIISPGGYAPEKMHVRNEWMVHRCDRLCALWDGSPGGTANCVRYAEKRKRPVDYVWGDFQP